MREAEVRARLKQIAHDIRGPITTIGGFSELLEQSLAEDDERRAHLAAIRRAVRRLRELADRLSHEAQGGD
ncbi:MAG: hypothetical protein KGM44_13820 [bacterium]|nr:hypothetical protein [bacterium]